MVGVSIFVVAVLVWLRSSDSQPIVHWGGWAVGIVGWAIYYFAAWIARCPACGAWIYRDAIFGDIAPTCPTCGRDRYAVEAEGDRA